LDKNQLSENKGKNGTKHELTGDEKMQCNIDARGRANRLKGGIISLIFAIIIGALIYFNILESATWWYILLSAVFGGIFTIFEARAGWCIVRAYFPDNKHPLISDTE
tara:strand:- start:165 stop:485 length:321 start_codon:yes stop_codon:yes gene_type:complete